MKQQTNGHSEYEYLTPKSGTREWSDKSFNIGQGCERIRHLQSDQEILRLVRALVGHPKVEWKDSIKEVVAAHHQLQAGQDRRIDTRNGRGSLSHIEVSHPTELRSGQ